jgi:hypothetical protein
MGSSINGIQQPFNPAVYNPNNHLAFERAKNTGACKFWV